MLIFQILQLKSFRLSNFLFQKKSSPPKFYTKNAFEKKLSFKKTISGIDPSNILCSVGIEIQTSDRISGHVAGNAYNKMDYGNRMI